MNKLIDKPHLIFLLTIPVLILIGFLSGDAVLGINVHDTYFVIAYFHLTILFSIIFSAIGLGYWVMQNANRKLSKWLSGIHIGLTFGGILFVFILTRLFKEDILEYEFNNLLTSIITLIIIIITLGQIIFPINIINALLKKKNQTTINPK